MNTQKIKNLLKDPNTNWKYLIIIIFLALITGVGTLIFQSKFRIEISQIEWAKNLPKKGQGKKIALGRCYGDIPASNDLAKTCIEELERQKVDLKIKGYEPSDCQLVDSEEKSFELPWGNCISCNYICIEKEDDTANWKTYRNEESGYEIKYPLGWEQKNGALQKEDKEQGLKGGEGGPTYPFYRVEIGKRTYEHYTYSSIEDYIQKSNWLSDDVIIGYEKIAGTKAVRHYLMAVPGGGYGVSFVKDGIVWGIFYRWVFYEEKDKFLPIFDQILSTFRFIE